MKKHVSLTLGPLLLTITATICMAQQTAVPQSAPLPAATRPRTIAAPVSSAVAPSQPATSAKVVITPHTPGTLASDTSPQKVLPALPKADARMQNARVILPPKLPALPPPTTPSPVPNMSIEKLRTKLTDAQRLFKTRVVLTAATPLSTDLVTIAALDPDSSQVHLIRLTKGALLTRDTELTLSTSLGRTVRLRVLRPNYVNSAVAIYDVATNKSLAPLVIEYPIEKGGRFREMAYYTSAHPSLVTYDVIKAGQSYVRTMLDAAAKRLRLKGIQIAPDLIDIAERLCIVEHVDHDRFLREDRVALYEEIFALYALNELDTYKYSVSTAGAGGMVQMIPSTYQMLRQLHPAVGLNPDFVLGMRNHGNALEAMLVYISDTWNSLGIDADINYALSTRQATKAELLAAGYNSNPMRLPNYLVRGGNAWRTLVPRETQMYLQIYGSLDKMIPMKTRAKSAASGGTVAAGAIKLPVTNVKDASSQ